jgi:hypothetical protein
MKKIFTLIFAFGLVSMFSASGQNNTVSLPHVIETPGIVDIPINVDFSEYEVCAFDIEVNFDGDVLQFQSAVDNTWSVSVGSNANTVNLAWAGTSSNYSGELLKLRFNYLGGTTSLTFTVSSDPGASDDPSWLTDCTIGDPAPITTTFTSGSITQTAHIPLQIWGLLIGIGLIVFASLGWIYRIQ